MFLPRLTILGCLNAPFGARRFLTARRVAPPVTRGNAMSDRQWSKKHPSDQQARGQNIRLFVATTRIATDRPQDEFRSGNRRRHRTVSDLGEYLIEVAPCSGGRQSRTHRRP